MSRDIIINTLRKDKAMNLKINFLSIIFMTISMSVFVNAQTARNPLNHEPAYVTLQKRISSWKLSDETFFQADGTPIDKRSFNYNEAGRVISDVSFSRNVSDNSWRETTTHEYFYADKKETVITSTMGFSNLQNTSKVETMYDAAKKPAYSLTYNWNHDADNWSVTPFLRCEWIYNDNEQVITYQKQFMNPNTNQWDDFNVRILYSYDEKGALTDEIYQSWNPAQSAWIDKGRYTYSNSGEQQKIATSLIYVSDKWLVDGKTVYSYDTEGKLVRCDFYADNTGNTLNAYSLCSYSENAEVPVLVDANEIQVYPNPAVSSFILAVPEAYTGKTMYLFDSYGKQAKSMVINNQETQISVDGLSGGAYILKIGDITKKVLIRQ